MAIDGIVTRALARESEQLISQGRINKIYQPNPTDLLLHIRGGGRNVRLLLSAHPVYARVHTTDETYENPLEPPMFCMLLRKHLEGGIITSVAQVGLERIITFDVRARNELGDIVNKRLIVEIMGRHSNIVLIDPASGHIYDGIRRVTPAISQYRQIVPGATYVAPPDQGKRDPLTVDKADFLKRLDFNSGRLDKQLVAAYTGIGPLLAKEIVHRAGIGSRENYWRAFHDIMADVRADTFAPTLVYGKKKDVFAAVSLTHVAGEVHRFPTMHGCVAAYFSGKAERDAVKNRTHDLMRFLSNEWKKNENKLKKMRKELADTARADEYRLYGELLTAYMYQVTPGARSIDLVNYYDEAGATVTIPLDPSRSPADNAQHYFKKYNKEKARTAHITAQIEKTAAENDYLATVLQQLESAGIEHIEDIREELIEEGYLRKQARRDGRRAKQKKDKRPELTRFTSSEGIPIYVGRNNRQNDYLTNRLASSDDTWLHTKDIPGSHVVIRGTNFGEATLMEAAQLAAFFSKGRASSQVPVDYTAVKHVRKPSGAKPGFVIYDHQKTVYVNPDEAMVRQMAQEQ
ncbi:Rqc2 family fibronectin-binding protein [Numidum massiliense]|uniref:Rqc2 family fibronectin-binding protein n=1 Tax=Numidum massiliense TaxID=1522315 RepID=UPI0006D5706C|nr:NFACT RNA binding domain-containing protein [Numidum massiliense]